MARQTLRKSYLRDDQSNRKTKAMTIRKQAKSQFYYALFSVRGQRFNRSTGQTDKIKAMECALEMRKVAIGQYIETIKKRKERAFFEEEEQEDRPETTEAHLFAFVSWLFTNTNGKPYEELDKQARDVIFRRLVVATLGAMPAIIPSHQRSLRGLANALECSPDLLSRISLGLADIGFIARAGAGVRQDQTRNRSETIHERIKRHHK